MSRLLPVGVIGVGALGRHHARHLAQLDGACLVGVTDTDRDRARAVAAELGTEACDLEALLDRVEAVTIAVPTPAHAEVGLHALERGIPVLMEKPLASTLAEADQLIAAAAATGVQLQVGHIERFNPAVRELKRCIERGDMGEIVSVFARRVGVMPPQVKDANVILDLAIHDIDVFRYLLGADSPTEVFCNAGRVNGGDLLDYADVFLRFGRVACLLQVNWVTPVKIRELAVTGTRGYAEVEYVRQELRYHSAQAVRPVDSYSEVTAYSEQAPELLAHEHVEPLARELGEFLRAVEGRPAEIVSGEEGKRSMEIALQLVERAELVESG